MFCGRCGQEMQDGTQFCPRCGLAQQVQAVPQAKPAKKSIAQQVAELTPKEKKTVMRIGCISLVILALAIVAGVLCWVQGSYLHNEQEEAWDAYLISSEKSMYLMDMVSNEETEEKWDRYKDAADTLEDYIKTSMYVWGGVFVVGVVLVAVVYSYFPCYKDRRFYYMLLHKDAR